MSLSLRGRIVIVAAILLCEALVLSLSFDGSQLASRQGWLPALLLPGGALAARFAIVLAAVMTAAVLLKRVRLPPLDCTARPVISVPALLLHGLALAALTFVSRVLYGDEALAISADAMTALWGACALAVAATGAVIVLPVSDWIAVVKPLRLPLAVAAAAAVAACWVGMSARQLWEPTRWLTFAAVQATLEPFLPLLIVKPEQFVIDTGRFGVVISPECSGLEGLGLLLIFGVVWMAAFHRGLGWPRCLLLLALGALVLYGSNVLRIAALLMIGHFGARDIAVTGFHSQAGWIAFSATALGLTFIGQRASEAARSAPARAKLGMAAALLVPFLATVAAGMIVGAVSARFEWFYGLRVCAAAAALWRYRRPLKKLEWRLPGWPAAVGGLGASLVWLGLEPLFGHGFTLHQPPPPELSSAGSGLAGLWIAIRLIGGTIIVPIVEELAFRAFLLRRVQSAEFETVPLRQWTVWAAVSSSVLFGALHGSRWVASSLAGLLYAWAMTRRGNIVDAMAAHAITNGLIAVLVLGWGLWSLW